jgi:FAD/FMN-containing dehydrogenase
MVHLEQRPPRELLVEPGGALLLTRDMTAIFSASMTLAEAQRRLAEIGQWLAIDGEPDATLGTLVDRNSTGPLRLGFGGWRDLLLGVQFHNGRGELITAGGRTMKNVAGYDLTKFMVGGHGVFGKLATITVRTNRRPAGAIVGQFAPDPSIFLKHLPTSMRPQWAMLDRESLWLGYLADPTALAFYRERLPGIGATQVIERSLDEDEHARRSSWQFGQRTFHLRASVPPMQVKTFAESANLTDWIADAAFGIVLGSVDSAHQAEAPRTAATALGGKVLFWNRDDPTSLDISTNPVERQIIERLKDAFDPDGTLSPLPWRHR